MLSFATWLENTEVKAPKIEEVENIQIEGDENFINKTKKALILLSKSKTFQKIKSYIGKIKQHAASGMVAWANPPTFEVGKQTYSSDTKWYASTIAHDTYHSYLYHNNQEWNGKKAEQNCLRIQLEVLEEIGSVSGVQKKYLKSLAEDPTYQEIPYEKRYW